MTSAVRLKRRSSLRIGELARASGVPVRTLRFYERMGLLTPAARTAAGYRLFDPGVVDRLRFIRRAQTLGLSLKDIRSILLIRDGGEPPCVHIRDLLERQLGEVEEQIERLNELREDLVQMIQRFDEVLVAAPEGSLVCPCFEQEAIIARPKDSTREA